MSESPTKGGTVKVRPLIAAKERGPGPGRYALPTTFGGKGHDATKKLEPAFSFGAKLPKYGGIFTKTESPGPAYAVAPNILPTGKTGDPSYSLSGRFKDLKPGETPSPGAYKVEDVKPQGNEQRAPSYSMGTRTALRKTDTTPAPSVYTISSTVGTKTATLAASPLYSMPGRSKTGGFAVDLAKTPGPGRYGQAVDSIKNRNPSYSLQGRTYVPQDNTKKPGPDVYAPEKVTVNKRTAASYSMGVRHSEYTAPLIVDIPDS